MDFSKIKKIFYIIAIISMLLSIKSKVFGASYDYTFKDTTDTVSLFPVSDYYFFCYGKKNTNNTFKFNLFVCDQEFTIADDYSTINFSQGSSCWYIQYSGETLVNITNRIESFQSSDLGLLSRDFSKSISFSGYDSDDYFANFDLKFVNGDIFVDNSVSQNPFFANPEELEDAPENVFIELGDYSANDYLYFHLLEVTNIMPMSNNDSTYYYNDHTFALNKDSKYYTQLLDTTKYYYEIPRSALGLNPNTSYFYVLTSSSTQIDNSINPITEGDDIYDVIMQDTTGIITQDMATNDKLQNINQEFRDYQQQQQEFQNQNSITTETEAEIDSNLNFNNQNSTLNSLNNGFFSRLTSMLSNLSSYNLAEDTSVSLPLPNSNKNIVLHSIDIHNNITGALRLIINAFWVYIFTFYLWKFINKIYISVSSGNILDSFSSSGEAITNDML